MAQLSWLYGTGYESTVTAIWGLLWVNCHGYMGPVMGQLSCSFLGPAGLTATFH